MKNVFLLALLVVIILFLYSFGVTGAFYYDDIRPLSALNSVQDFESALLYIASETSGPLGRPLSMISFLLHAGDWPTINHEGNSRAFFLFNITLHAVNGLLVFGLTYFMSTLYHDQKTNCIAEKKATFPHFYIAFFTSALWLVLPIHVSTSLIAIQRMAGLSAFFVFSGLLLYVYGLYKQSIDCTNNNKNSGLLLQLTGAIAFTILAVFSKENGVLLPVFILVIELTLFLQVSGITHRRKLRISCGCFTLMIVVLYLVIHTFSSNNILQGREFTLIERLLTQPQILLEYLRLAFIPNIASFNPFHDNYQHINNLASTPKALISISIIFIATIVAIRYRQKYPLYFFAVCWFLAAHLLESTTLSLELYFEHRNYVALFGPCVAIIFSIFAINQCHYNKPIIIFSVYWLFLASSLAMTTMLWGNPNEAAKIWYLEQKGSSRATENLSINLYSQGDTELAYEVVKAQVKVCPNCILNISQSLFFSCLLNLEDETTNGYNSLIIQAPDAIRTIGLPASLANIHTLIENNDCNYLTVNDLKAINSLFLALPNSAFNKKIGFLKNLYRIALAEKNRSDAISLLYLAWSDSPSHHIANELVALLLGEKNHQRATEFVEKEACQPLESNHLKTKEQLKSCHNLRIRIKQADKT